MEKSLVQCSINNSKTKSVSSSSESEDDCDKNATNPRNYIIRAFQENWKMDYLASPIVALYEPQCLICYKILSENKKSSVKTHCLSKHATSIEKIFNQQR